MYTGVSAGSINTIGQIGWESFDTVAATEYLSNMWASVDNTDVYRLWEGEGVIGLAKSCLSNISCLDTSPALLWLQSQLEQFESVKRRFTLSAVNIANGEYVSFN